MADCDATTAINTLIDAAILTPQSVSADGVTVTNRSLAELAAEASRRAANCAGRCTSPPFRMMKTKPPGAF